VNSGARSPPAAARAAGAPISVCSEDSARRLLGDEAPGAYVLWDERDRRTQLLAGSNWVFTLTLIADLALRQLPAIIAAVQQGAEQGMGRIRLRILSEVHGGGEWPHDEWGPLLDAADAVRLDHHETQWLSYARRSQASGVYNVEGFIGNGWYSGEGCAPSYPISGWDSGCMLAKAMSVATAAIAYTRHNHT